MPICESIDLAHHQERANGLLTSVDDFDLQQSQLDATGLNLTQSQTESMSMTIPLRKDAQSVSYPCCAHETFSRRNLTQLWFGQASRAAA